jgi:hypothetical protein
MVRRNPAPTCGIVHSIAAPISTKPVPLSLGELAAVTGLSRPAALKAAHEAIDLEVLRSAPYPLASYEYDRATSYGIDYHRLLDLDPTAPLPATGSGAQDSQAWTATRHLTLAWMPATSTPAFQVSSLILTEAQIPDLQMLDVSFPTTDVRCPTIAALHRAGRRRRAAAASTQAHAAEPASSAYCRTLQRVLASNKNVVQTLRIRQLKTKGVYRETGLEPATSSLGN